MTNSAAPTGTNDSSITSQAEAVEALGTEEILDDDGFMQDLVRKVEDTKRRLSVKENETLKLRFGGAVADVAITRSFFEDLTRDRLDETFTITQRALDTLRELHGDVHINEVLLVGGSSLIARSQFGPSRPFRLEPEVGRPSPDGCKGRCRLRSSTIGLEPDPSAFARPLRRRRWLGRTAD